MTKRKHDYQYYQDIDLVKRAELLRKNGCDVKIQGSVYCECYGSLPIDDRDVKGGTFPHRPGCDYYKTGSK